MGDEANPLTPEILGKCLSNIERTVDGSAYAFTKLDCSDKDLSDLGTKVGEFEHLRHAVIANNKIADLSPVAKLPHLLTLTASSNAAESLECMKDGALPWCQILDVSSNRLASLVSLAGMVRLRVLHLQGNQIASLEGFDGHPEIEILQLQQNKLTTLDGFGAMPKLQRLDLSENELTSLNGLDAPVLEVCDLSKNQLANLDGVAGIPQVKSLNLSGNLLEKDEEMAELRKLNKETLPALDDLTLEGNPFVEACGDGYRTEVLICVPSVPKIDGTEVTSEEQEGAIAEEKKREEEKAAAEAAAAEADAAEA